MRRRGDDKFGAVECIGPRIAQPARTSLIALLAFASLGALSAPVASAQTSIDGATELLHAANGRAVATLRDGARVESGDRRSGFTEVTIQGWIASRLLGGARDTFSVSVNGSDVNLRSGPQTTASIVADLRNGMGVTVVRRDGDWTLVRRTGWVRSRAVRSAATSATGVPSPSGPQPASAADPLPPPDSNAFVTTRSAVLRESPSAPPRATVGEGARLEAIARERGWVKVRLEGWMQEDALAPADTTLRSALSPADLRADPDGTRGRIVRWEMQSLAFQIADPLQENLAREEPYLLARGPGADQALVYLTIPPSLVQTARALPPLAPIIVTARVRVGRSSPGGVPILDVMSLSRR